MNLAFVAVALVFCSVATASAPETWQRGTPAAPVGPAVLPAVEDAVARRARARCDTCGVVEAIRHIEQGGGTPASYEFTVRLRDGSIRTSTAASAANWRIGDRIMLIGGGSVAKL